MSLQTRITDDMKNAMRAKDTARLSTIRMLIAAVKQKEIDERIDLDDVQVIGVVDKLILAIFVLEVVAAWRVPSRTVPRTIHHKGYGSFMVAGRTIRLPSRIIRLISLPGPRSSAA